MAKCFACPYQARLESLLDDTLTEPALTDLKTHLEDCPACQQALEVLTAGGAAWAEVAQELGRGQSAAAVRVSVSGEKHVHRGFVPVFALPCPVFSGEWIYPRGR